MLQRLLIRLTNRLDRLRGDLTHGPVAGAARQSADRMIAEGVRAESSGNPREACEQYRGAVRADPGYAKAHLNLGIGLQAIGDAEGALRSYEAALALDPEDVYANYNLGNLLYARGELARAERLLRSALDRKPDFPDAHVVLSNVYDAQGDFAAAVVELELVLKQRPDYAGALYNYALVLKKLGRLQEAESALGRLLGVDPGYPRASYELAILLQHRSSRLQDAGRLFRLALEQQPEFPEAHAGLYEVYRLQGDFPAAGAELEAALKQRPGWAEALHNYGMLLRDWGRLTEAETVLRRAVAADPECFPAYRMLGSVLLTQSRVGEALEILRAGRERGPDESDLESAELFTLNFSEDISSKALFARHRAFGVRVERAHPARFGPFQNSRDPERRLRVGYVSHDFTYHPVALFFLPLLERHDRSAMEIYCYSSGERTDEVTRQLAGRADVWRETASVSSTELADLIHSDNIDILVDLSGHTGIPALRVFAQQPAPVQVTWLGYMNTTGLTRIHYRVCDGYTDPPGPADRLHTETLVRLAFAQWCYRPYLSIDPATQAPVERNGYITFGSFNQVSKVSSLARQLWAEILLQLPESRLVIDRASEGAAQDRLLRDLETAGVAAGRISFRQAVPLEEYFRRFNDVDIALDTMPYSGCTTTCDTLWMGVPVVTLPGSSSLSRATASILSVTGLADWIAPTREDYVRLNLELAQDRARLSELRGLLRQRMRVSPLMDETGFARGVEAAYRGVWKKWCEGAAR